MEKYMGNPDDWNKMVHRKNVSRHTYNYIARRKCLHVDVWLIVDTSAPNREYCYFVIERHVGGMDLFDRHVFFVNKAGMFHFMGDVIPQGRQVTMNSAWGRKRRWLHNAYATHIYPNLRRVPANGCGFKGHISVRVWAWGPSTAPEPMDGITNLYDLTGRARRDRGFAKVPREHHGGDVREEPAHPSTYDKRFATPGYTAEERSLLRTLDKLLR